MCIYIHTLVTLLIYWWAFGLFPLFIYCKYCYYEHWCINTCLTSSWLSILLVIYAGVELLDPMILVSLFKKLPNCIPQRLCHSKFLPAMHKGFNFSTATRTLFTSHCCFYNSHPNGREVVFHCGFDLLSLTTNDIEDLYLCLFAIGISFFGEKCSFILSSYRILYILGNDPLSDIWFTNTSSFSVGFH